MACGVAAGMLHGVAKAQLPHGPYIGLELKAGMPAGKPFSEMYAPGFGGAGVFGVQVGDNSFITFSGEAMSYKWKINEHSNEPMKPMNLFSLGMGLRYNFWKEESVGALYIEPRVAYTLVGKTYNTFSVNPIVGYSFKGRLDLSLWFAKTTAAEVIAKTGAMGVGFHYNLFFSGKE